MDEQEKKSDRIKRLLTWVGAEKILLGGEGVKLQEGVDYVYIPDYRREPDILIKVWFSEIGIQADCTYRGEEYSIVRDFTEDHPVHNSAGRFIYYFMQMITKGFRKGW